MKLTPFCRETGCFHLVLLADSLECELISIAVLRVATNSADFNTQKSSRK